MPVSDRGFQWAELYFPPDGQVTEGVDSVLIDLSGEIYGAIPPITAFRSGTESTRGAAAQGRLVHHPHVVRGNFL